MKKKYLMAIMVGMIGGSSIAPSSLAMAEEPAAEESMDDGKVREILEEISNEITEETFGSNSTLYKDLILDHENPTADDSLLSVLELCQENEDYDSVFRIVKLYADFFGDEVLDAVKKYAADELEKESNESLSDQDAAERIAKADSVEEVLDLLDPNTSDPTQVEEGSEGNTDETDKQATDIQASTVPENSEESQNGSAEPVSVIDDTSSGDDSAEALVNAIENALSQVAQIDYSSLKGDYAIQAQSVINDGVTSIQNVQDISEIQGIVDGIRKGIQGLMETQESEFEQKKASAINTLRQHYTGMDLGSAELQKMADQAYKNGEDSIYASTTEEMVANALTEAMSNLDAIASETEDVLSKIRAAALNEIRDLRNTIYSGNSSVEEIYSMVCGKIEAARNAKEISAAKQTGSALLDSMKSLVDSGDYSATPVVVNTMKNYTEDSSTVSVLGILAAKNAADINEGLEVVDEAVYVVNSDNISYAQHLNKKLQALAEKCRSTLQAQANDLIRQAGISSAASKEAMFRAYEACEKELVDLSKEDVLAIPRRNAEQELSALLSGIADHTLKDQVDRLIREASVSLSLAESQKEIDAIVSSTTQKVNELKSQAAAETELEQEKESALAELEGLLSGISDADLKDQLYLVVISAEADVRNALSAEDVRDIVSKTKVNVKQLKKEYAENTELTEKKTATISKVDTYISGKTLTKELNTLVNTTKQKILASASTPEIESLYEEFVSKFQSMSQTSLRTAYSDKLDALLNDVDRSSVSSETYESIKAFIQTAKDNINSASSEATMQSILAQAQTKINALISTGTGLDAIKKKAIEELQNSTTLTTDSAAKVIATYTNKINGAETEEQVQEYLNEGKQLLSKLSSGNALLNANTSTTTNGASTGVSVTPTLGADGSGKVDATSKGSAPTAAVKTGDENGYRIILSWVGVGIGVAAGLIYSLMRKKVKKNKSW